jgi:hypothetical protein
MHLRHRACRLDHDFAVITAPTTENEHGKARSLHGRSNNLEGGFAHSLLGSTGMRGYLSIPLAGGRMAAREHQTRGARHSMVDQPPRGLPDRFVSFDSPKGGRIHAISWLGGEGAPGGARRSVLLDFRDLDGASFARSA